MKPMLVELHSFPGFEESRLTPLPSSIHATFILNVVTKAQLDLQKKVKFYSENQVIEFFFVVCQNEVSHSNLWSFK